MSSDKELYLIEYSAQQNQFMVGELNKRLETNRCIAITQFMQLEKTSTDYQVIAIIEGYDEAHQYCFKFKEKMYLIEEKELLKAESELQNRIKARLKRKKEEIY